VEEALGMKKIPQTDSIEELAQFWDTHDLTEFKDELEEVGEPVFDRGAQTVMRIRLLPDQAEALKRIAESRGMDQADLIREWVSEKLRPS
jgi:flagellar biosynthesis/type III secretory pathway M-ring protein FliF/YscJ